MATVTIDNFTTTLKQSTQGRAGTPDGNIYFDYANDLIEIITVEDLATVDFGGGAVANPLTDYDGITDQALYAFERQERRTDEALRKFWPGTAMVFKNAGAGELNGVKLAENGNVSDWTKMRGSGLIVRAATTDGSKGPIDREYHGVRSLNNIDATSQPYYMLCDDLTEAGLQAATPVNFARLGPIDEMIQTFGTTANGDADAGDFDNKSKVLVVSVRTFQNNYGRATSTGSGVAELGGFSAGYGVGESLNPAITDTLADVYTSPVAPYDGLSLEVLGAPTTKTGFIAGSADYDIIITNTGGASLAQVRQWLDAISQSDTDSDTGAGSLLGKRAEELYLVDDQGRVVTGDGVFIEGLGAADQLGVVQTDITGTAQTYPLFTDLVIEVGAAAAADPLAWYHVFIFDGAGSLDYDTITAETLLDSGAVEVKGDVTTDVVGTKITRQIDYDSNDQAGLALATDKELVVLVEGDGGATYAATITTWTRTSVLNVSCVPGAEGNI